MRLGDRIFQTLPPRVGKWRAYFHLLFRSIEKEISFDFGTESEFTYLYNQCYEMNTSEYAHAVAVLRSPVFKFSLAKDLVAPF